VSRLELLSNRERAVLLRMMEGLTVREIAHVEYVSVETVRSQVRSILLKTGKKTQLSVVVYAYGQCWPGDLSEHVRDVILAKPLEVAAFGG